VPVTSSSSSTLSKKPPWRKDDRLDGAAGDGAAEGDALELGHDGGDEAEGQGGADEVAEADAGLGDAAPALGVDLEHVAEGGGVELAAAKPRVAGAWDEVMDAALVDVGGLAGDGELADLLDEGLDALVVVGEAHIGVSYHRGPGAPYQLVSGTSSRVRTSAGATVPWALQICSSWVRMWRS
jgi:hypothetical protein